MSEDSEPLGQSEESLKEDQQQRMKHRLCATLFFLVLLGGVKIFS